MIFICALIPIANLAVSLAYGGACALLYIMQTLLYLPLFAKIKTPKILLLPLCTASVVLRFSAIFQSAQGALGNTRGIIIVLACVIASAFAAYNGDSAIYTATPVFFITALLAAYITAVSIGNAEFYEFSAPSYAEAVSAIICPLSSCVAFSQISSYPPIKRFKGAMCGILVCAVFLLFKSAKAELGFISVPLAATVSALEIKSIIGITAENRE